MKPKNLFIILALCIIVLLIGNNSSLSFYQSSVSSSISSKWNNSKSIGKFNDSSDGISFSSIPVVVVYKSKKVGDIHSSNPVIIDISDKKFGLLWLPIFKISDYDFTVTCKHANEIKTEDAKGYLNIDGEIYVSGQYRVIGLCPTKTAKNLVVDKVMKDIYEDVKKHIK